MPVRVKLVAVLIPMAVMVQTGLAQTRQSKVTTAKRGAESIPPPAWQRGDPALAAKWRQITGRYIFQRACVSCHTWGPAHWTREQWRAYLPSFPRNHQPEVSDRYRDLTAMFGVGAMVPTNRQRHDALKAFLLSSAPALAPKQPPREERFDGLPRVGQPAPGFSITDVRGRTFSLSRLRGRRRLVLVFSRAHW